MIKPFFWMFEKKEFYKNYFFLLSINIIFFIIGLFIFYLSQNINIFDGLLDLVVYAISGLFIIIPLLISLGFFWELTAGIISRELHIQAAQIFDGKVTEKFVYNFPEEFSVKKLLWRGIASIIATILLILAYFYFFTSDMFESSFVGLAANIVMGFFAIFIPALLWNYAKINSIFSVWNILKAKYIVGNYTFNYFKNLLLAGLFACIDGLLIYAIWKILCELNIDYFALSSSDFIIMLILIIICLIKFTYNIFVYSYLLGTITPPAEG